jgi:hypothetical protein
VLCPTPPEKLCDREGRPYFLWDCDVTLDQLRRYLQDEDEAVRDYWRAKVLRQAKPDDALTLMTVAEIRAAWPRIEHVLGRQRAFWAWLLDRIERRAE